MTPAVVEAVAARIVQDCTHTSFAAGTLTQLGACRGCIALALTEQARENERLTRELREWDARNERFEQWRITADKQHREQALEIERWKDMGEKEHALAVHFAKERDTIERATLEACEHFFSFKLSDSHTWTVGEIKRECRARIAAQGGTG